MKQKTLIFFITNEEMLNERNHVEGFNGLFRHIECTPFDIRHGIVIHVNQPISGKDIIHALNMYAKCLEERGLITGHGYVLPLGDGKSRGRYMDILTLDDKYKQGRFMMDTW